MVYVSGINCEVYQILVNDLAGKKLVFFKGFSANFLFSKKRKPCRLFLKTSWIPPHLDTHLT